MRFFSQRISKKQFLLSIGIGIAISIFQIFSIMSQEILKNNVFHESPYTQWLSIDPFGFLSVLFFVLLPLIAAIPAAGLLRQDLNSGFFNQVKLYNPLGKVIRSYAITSFVMGFIAILIPLAINFAIYFTLLPNVIPDNLLNDNLLIFTKNTLFVSLYYTHPFIHAVLSMLFASFWGGLFSAFATGVSLWISNIFLVIASGLLLQIMLLVLNMLIPIGDDISFAPFDFLKEKSDTNLSLGVTAVMTILMIVCIIGLFKIGKEKKIVW
jgi:hypothetical protein